MIQAKTLGVVLLLAVAAISVVVVVSERPTALWELTAGPATEARKGKQSAVSAPMAVVANDLVQIAVFNASDKTIHVEPRLLDAIKGARLDPQWLPVNLDPGTGMTWSLTADGP